jgi:hypothetical protein
MSALGLASEAPHSRKIRVPDFYAKAQQTNGRLGRHFYQLHAQSITLLLAAYMNTVSQNCSVTTAHLVRLGLIARPRETRFYTFVIWRPPTTDYRAGSLISRLLCETLPAEQ